MSNVSKHNAADAIQCLIEDFEMYLDGRCVPDNDCLECSRDNAILVQEALATVRNLGAAIEQGDPQVIANIWLQLKPQVELHEKEPAPAMA